MTSLNDLYRQIILDHNKSPHNFGSLPDKTNSAEGFNALCGDKITIDLIIKNNKVTDVKFQGQGCAISTASASIMTDLIKNKTLQEIETLQKQFNAMITKGKKFCPCKSNEHSTPVCVFSSLHNFPTRTKCASMAWHTLKSAIKNDEEQTKFA